MTHRVFNLDLWRRRAVVEVDLDGVGLRALLRVQVVRAVLRVLQHVHFPPQRVDAGVLRHCVGAMVFGERAVEQGHGHGVLEAMVPVGRIQERPRLVDTPDA